MALELEHRRNEVAALAKENAKLNDLVKKLDAEIARLGEMIAEYKRAIQAGERAVEIKQQIENLYKESLTDSKKQIEKLKKSNRFLRKLIFVAAAAGAAFGVVVGK